MRHRFLVVAGVGIVTVTLWGSDALAQAPGGGGGPQGGPPGAPPIDSIFDRMDHNHDGSIDLEEFRHAQPPSGARHPGGPPPDGPPPDGPPLDGPPLDGGPGTGPHGGGPGGGPHGPGGGRGRPMPRPGFAFLDADGDGLVSRAEFAAGVRLWGEAHEAFRTADADRNRELSAAEYQAAGFGTAVTEIDADGNGTIAAAEFNAWLEKNRRKP